MVDIIGWTSGATKEVHLERGTARYFSLVKNKGEVFDEGGGWLQRNWVAWAQQKTEQYTASTMTLRNIWIASVCIQRYY